MGTLGTVETRGSRVLMLWGLELGRGPQQENLHPFPSGALDWGSDDLLLRC